MHCTLVTFWLVMIFSCEFAFGQKHEIRCSHYPNTSVLFSKDLSLTKPNLPGLIGYMDYKQNLGFFCIQEYKLEKAIKIPVKFRLGSLEYNNWLENKPKGLSIPAY